MSSNFLLQYAWTGIFFLIYAGGLSLAIINARRLNGAALFAILGCAIGLINTVVTPIIFTLLADSLANTFEIINLVRALVSGVGLSLLIAAIFVGRPRVPGPQPPTGQI